ncbi:Ycf66 family protein [Synechococcus sp. W4D4]|uniref:Ycf66 family protein n=1 Tax=Synechococcus sp. W4D4 TaxID=3392294 RepID=UPI0039ECE7F3
MVNASLNWASIVGIVLAVGGALLYFMRSFKPALARDYDVFFAAVGLLCGGILFFQGWRLDPILQFGQFLLAGTTVFFAYESVRLRGVTTEQARRSSYFDDDDEPSPRPRMGGGRDFRDDADRFEDPQPLRRRIRSRDDSYGDREEEDLYRPRRPARAAIPERAASRDDWQGKAGRGEREPEQSSRFRAGGAQPSSPEFGSRRQGRDDMRRGSRPNSRPDEMPRSSRRGSAMGAPSPSNPGVPQGAPYQASAKNNEADAGVSDAEFRPVRPSAGGNPSGPSRPRDNSSRFDD